MNIVDRRIRKLFLIFLALVSLSLAGCIIVPYPVSSEDARVDEVQIAGEVYVTVGPRKLLEEVSKKITEHNHNIEIVDPLEFRDTAFPVGG